MKLILPHSLLPLPTTHPYLKLGNFNVKVTLRVQLPPSSKCHLPLPHRGIPNSQIILLLPDDMACNTRNAFPGTVYNNADRALDLYGDDIELEYRVYEVAVENLIRVLTD